MSDNFLYDVFLSHSAKDKAVVRDVAERLRKDGVKVWFDEWVLPKDEVRRMKEEGPTHPSSFKLHPLEVEGLEPLARAGALHVGECARLGLGAVGGRDVPNAGALCPSRPLNKERRFLPHEP